MVKSWCFLILIHFFPRIIREIFNICNLVHEIRIDLEIKEWYTWIYSVFQSEYITTNYIFIGLMFINFLFLHYVDKTFILCMVQYLWPCYLFIYFWQSETSGLQHWVLIGITLGGFKSTDSDLTLTDHELSN